MASVILSCPMRSWHHCKRHSILPNEITASWQESFYPAQWDHSIMASVILSCPMRSRHHCKRHSIQPNEIMASYILSWSISLRHHCKCHSIQHSTRASDSFMTFCTLIYIYIYILHLHLNLHENAATMQVSFYPAKWDRGIIASKRLIHTFSNSWSVKLWANSPSWSKRKW